MKPLQQHILFLAILLLFSSCSYQSIPQSRPQAAQQATAGKLDQIVERNNSLNFTAIGDWGRNGYYHQDDTGETMGEVMQHIDGDFIISVGDNFYPDGVQSTQDYHWKSSFEQVYKHPGTYLDWWVILGNHDYRGNVQAQIDYSNISRRWNMPDRYYSKTFNLSDGTEILFVFIDTNPFNTPYLNDPLKKYGDVDKQDKQKQLDWMISTLQNSQAHWKIVVGHHQLFTGGRRQGSKNTVREQLLPVFKQQNIDLYLCGHEHHLEYNVTDGIHQIISGAGSSVRNFNGSPNTVFGKEVQGITAFSINREDIEFHFIDYLGNVLHTNRITK